jgi:pimeloyl-ACP methyl ester carboxylesterase
VSAPQTLPAVHDTGTGPALLMLHGYPMDATEWDHQVAALSGEFRCLRPDMWGCGSSPPPPANASTLDDYAATVLAALDARQVQRFAVLGLSMGGYIAFALWRLAAERISAFIVCSTKSGSDDDARRAERIAEADRLLREQSAEPVAARYGTALVAASNEDEVHVTDPLRGRIRRCTPEGLAFALRAMAARPDSAPLLPSITVPSLVIAGAGDRLIPPSESRSIAEAIPGAELMMIEGCGHVPNLENAPAFDAAVRGFLRSALGEAAA